MLTDIHLRARRESSRSFVKELRPDGFQLWVFERNTQARGFYERRGLELLRLTDGSENQDREPDALYEWRPG